MSEKLCVQWKEFQDNIRSAFRNFRGDNAFADVTLVSEDGQQVEAHKVILATSSPFFQKLFGKNKNPHPLVYMRGVKSFDLLAIVDFLYNGEANVFQENLDSFLAIAEELQLNGLWGKTDDKIKYFGGVEEKYRPSVFSPTINNSSENNPKSHSKGEPPNSQIQNPKENRTSPIPINFYGDMEELDGRVKSMMEKSQNKIANGPHRMTLADKCKVCGKEGGATQIRDHIEANHLEGITIPCNLCERTFRSRNGVRLHKRQHHLGSRQQTEMFST